jgi:urocanate hydratase
MSVVEKKYDAVKYKTPTGDQLNCKGWIQEAALRMLLNNLDPDVAERPEDLIVYGGRGKAARNFESLDLIIKALKDLKMMKHYWCKVVNQLAYCVHMQMRQE